MPKKARAKKQLDRLPNAPLAEVVFEMRWKLQGNAPFLTDHLKSSEPIANSHLSVNSTEVESLKEIADFHRRNWQEGRGKAALTVHKIFDYCDSARKSNVPITLNGASGIWEFADYDSKTAPAFRYRPVKPTSKNSLGSKSHCGVEFVRAFDEYRSTQFARRLAGKSKFHLL